MPTASTMGRFNVRQHHFVAVAAQSCSLPAARATRRPWPPLTPPAAISSSRRSIRPPALSDVPAPGGQRGDDAARRQLRDGRRLPGRARRGQAEAQARGDRAGSGGRPARRLRSRQPAPRRELAEGATIDDYQSSTRFRPKFDSAGRRVTGAASSAAVKPTMPRGDRHPGRFDRDAEDRGDQVVGEQERQWHAADVHRRTC